MGVLKTLAMLDDQGRPTQRYFEFLDQTQSAVILAEAIREAYGDLFAVNINAQNLSKSDLTNKFKTLLQGSVSEAVLEKMATTFLSLVKLADFSTQPTRTNRNASPDDSDDDGAEDEAVDDVEVPVEEQPNARPRPRQRPEVPRSFGGLHYNIQIILPETRDPQVYDALFRSLREHLFS